MTIAAAYCQPSESTLYSLSMDLLFKEKMSSKSCACGDKENHGEANGMAAVGEDAETAPKLRDISNQLTEKASQCERAEQQGEIKDIETKTTVPDEEKGGSNYDGPEIWTDIPLNDPDEELEANDRATWLVVEKGRFICRPMSPNPYHGWSRPQQENANEIHDEKI